jgi:hypothetical protein
MADLITTAELVNAVPSLATRTDLSQLVAAASLAVENRVGRTFARETITEHHDGRNLPRIWLRRRPVASVTSLTIDGTLIDNTGGDAYDFDPDTGEFWRGPNQGGSRFNSPFPTGKRGVVVVYVGGYDPIPADVKQATIIVAKHLADASRTPGTYKSESIGDYSYTLGDLTANGLPGAAEALLAKYIENAVL